MYFMILAFRDYSKFLYYRTLGTMETSETSKSNAYFTNGSLGHQNGTLFWPMYSLLGREASVTRTLSAFICRFWDSLFAFLWERVPASLLLCCNSLVMEGWSQYMGNLAMIFRFSKLFIMIAVVVLSFSAFMLFVVPIRAFLKYLCLAKCCYFSCDWKPCLTCPL